MARILAFTHSSSALAGGGWLRPLVVGGCALALILARNALPF